MEAQNYNMSVMMDQLSVQGGNIANIQDALSSKCVIPETHSDLTLLSNAPLMVERPGFPGDMVDLRAIASTLKLNAHSLTDRWRQLARMLLEKVVPKPVQYLYTGAANGTSYYALPSAFTEGIISCCAISSNLTNEGAASCLPIIAHHVRSALTNKLHESRKYQSKTVDEFLQEAIEMGWKPPGQMNNEAIAPLEDPSNAMIQPSSMLTDSPVSRMTPIGTTPVSSLLRRQGQATNKRNMKKTRIPNKSQKTQEVIQSGGIHSPLAPVSSPSSSRRNTLIHPETASSSATTMSELAPVSTPNSTQNAVIARPEATFTMLTPVRSHLNGAENSSSSMEEGGTGNYPFYGSYNPYQY